MVISLKIMPFSCMNWLIMQNLQPSSSLPSKFSSPGRCFPHPKYTFSLLHLFLFETVIFRVVAAWRAAVPVKVELLLAEVAVSPPLTSSSSSRFTTLSFTFIALSAVPCPFRLTSPSLLPLDQTSPYLPHLLVKTPNYTSTTPAHLYLSVFVVISQVTSSSSNSIDFSFLIICIISSYYPACIFISLSSP